MKIAYRLKGFQSYFFSWVRRFVEQISEGFITGSYTIYKPLTFYQKFIDVFKIKDLSFKYCLPLSSKSNKNIAIGYVWSSQMMMCLQILYWKLVIGRHPFKLLLCFLQIEDGGDGANV